MGLLKDWTTRWITRLSGRTAKGPGSVFITLDEKIPRWMYARVMPHRKRMRIISGRW